MSASKNVIGTISKTLNPSEFEWRISDCRDEIFEVENGKWLESPTFSFSSAPWCIQMCPNGYDSSCKEWISLYLWKKGPDAEKNISFSLVLSLQGIQLRKCDTTRCFKKDAPCWGWYKHTLRKEVLDQWSKETNKCSEQLTVKVTLTETVPHDEEEGALSRVRTKGKQILSQNFKDLLLHSDDHDLVLKVKDKELKAHRNIMQSRCPVFKSMLSHDMSENNSGVVVVEIPDCDPVVFEQFLLHVYTGEVDVLDESTMLGLFYIADKYDMENLKEECLAVIKESLSAPVICDVIKLAVDHSDEVLLKLATKYFLDHSKDILDTVGWVTFMKKNTAQANELIKALNNKNSVSKD